MRGGKPNKTFATTLAFKVPEKNAAALIMHKFDLGAAASESFLILLFCIFGAKEPLGVQNNKMRRRAQRLFSAPLNSTQHGVVTADTALSLAPSLY